MLSMPEPGTPFHRLARTPAHRWWRPVLGTVALTGVAYLLWYPLAYADGWDSIDLTVATWLYRMAEVLLGAAALLAARYAQARPAGTLTSVLGRTRWRWLGACLLEAAATVAMLIAGSALLYVILGYGLRTGSGDDTVMAATLYLFLAPTVLFAVAAEYVFRGWLLQAVGVFGGGPWPAIAVQAVLYAAVFYTADPWAFADGLVLGAVLGWLAVRTGGLEAGIALVVGLDILSVSSEVVSGALTSDVPHSDLEWQLFALDAVVTVAYAAVVVRLARRRGVATVTPGPARSVVLEPV